PNVIELRILGGKSRKNERLATEAQRERKKEGEGLKNSRVEAKGLGSTEVGGEKCREIGQRDTEAARGS
ncbi:MAG: hypothetical protein AABY63_01235, partial [candidate division NC10 bacterium]